eukprot:2273611-Prymnesium_polylepis.3
MGIRASAEESHVAAACKHFRFELLHGIKLGASQEALDRVNSLARQVPNGYRGTVFTGLSKSAFCLHKEHKQFPGALSTVVAKVTACVGALKLAAKAFAERGRPLGSNEQYKAKDSLDAIDLCMVGKSCAELGLGTRLVRRLRSLVMTVRATEFHLSAAAWADCRGEFDPALETAAAAMTEGELDDLKRVCAHLLQVVGAISNRENELHDVASVELPVFSALATASERVVVKIPSDMLTLPFDCVLIYALSQAVSGCTPVASAGLLERARRRMKVLVERLVSSVCDKTSVMHRISRDSIPVDEVAALAELWEVEFRPGA